MKMLVEKIADGLGVFSPIVVLLFVCSSYLETPMEKNSLSKSETRGEKNRTEKLSDLQEDAVYRGFIHSPYMMSKFYDSPDITRFRPRK